MDVAGLERSMKGEGMRQPAEDVRVRFPMMALGMIALAVGLWGGLVRIGWALPQGGSAMLHGPLMICGFLGTVISLERAVAYGRLWSYAAPLLAGVGGVVLIVGSGATGGPGLGALLISCGSLLLVGIFAAVLRMQSQPFLIVMTAGAAAWVVGNVLWLAGWPLSTVVWWWMGFLLLTIAGERLELSRMLLHRPHAQRAFLVVVVFFVLGLAGATVAPGPGVRLIGGTLVLLALWLLRFDIVRRTVRQRGLTRYIAYCLIAGYVWLLVGGLILVVFGFAAGGPLYDAALHAVFVGFVFSMIFGHAPIIFPSVLRVPVAYRPAFYVHLAVLHLSLAGRTAADLAALPGLRRWGGMINAAAIVLFLVATAASAVSERRRLRSAATGT